MDRRNVLKSLGVAVGAASIPLTAAAAWPIVESTSTCGPLSGHPVDTAVVDGWNIDIYMNTCVRGTDHKGYKDGPTVGWKAKCPGECGKFYGSFFAMKPKFMDVYYERRGLRSAVVYHAKISRTAHMKETGCGG